MGQRGVDRSLQYPDSRAVGLTTSMIVPESLAGWASPGFPIYVVHSAVWSASGPPANFKVRNCRYDKAIATSSVMLVERLIRPE